VRPARPIIDSISPIEGRLSAINSIKMVRARQIWRIV
jgi:hypothetical protein